MINKNYNKNRQANDLKMVRVHESSPVGGEKCMLGCICGKDKFSAWSERVEEREREDVRMIVKMMNWNE